MATPPAAFVGPQFFAKFASATRACRGASLSPEGMADLARAGLGWLSDGAGVDLLLRVALLVLADRELAGPPMVDLADNCFRHGDNEERRAVLRALSLLTEPAGYVDIAAQATRTSVATVFQALACENPFPARHLPELNFNQMVLKALFIEVPLPRVMGLGTRVTPELARMAEGYAAERRAAGRSVPADIGLLARS